MTRGADGELLWDGTEVALLQVGVAGVWYDARRLSFANAQSLFDASSSTLQIGAPLYMNSLLLGDATTNTGLSRGTNGELLWGTSEVALVGSQPSLDVYVNGSLVPNVTGLAFSNHSNGFDVNTGVLSIGAVLSQSLLRLGSNAVYGDLTLGSNNELLWNNNPMASEALVATKQDALAHYSETSGATSVFAEGQDTATPVSLHIAWTGPGSYNNVAGSHQELTLPALWLGYFSTAGGTKIYLSVDIRAGTLQDLVFASHVGTAWFDTITFQGLSSTEFRNYTWQFTVPANKTQFVMSVGIIPSNLGVDMSSTNQPAGTVQIRNLRLYTTQDEAVISAHLTCQKDVTFENSIETQHANVVGAITASQYFSSSDRSLKSDIEDASLQSCQEVFDAVEVKTYERTDLAPGKRIGFIAQDVEQSLPAEFANLVGTRPSGLGEVLTLDYSRLVTVLWGVVKNLQARIEALEAQ
jgi:hypothetical protein